MKKVLITGATGLIGRRLTEVLHKNQYEVSWLVRKHTPDAPCREYLWDIDQLHVEEEAIRQADYIVHLAGENIAKEKWTLRRKQLLLESRLRSTRLLIKYLQTTAHHVRAVVAASAIGYYGNSGDQWVTESSPRGKGFLADLCVQWEAAAQPIADITRLVQLRIGIVLSTRGGALPELVKPIRYGITPYLGNGNQYYSWIHIDDVCGLILHALEQETVSGIYNAVAPVPVQQKNLIEAIRTSLNKLSVPVPAPGLFLRWTLGEMATALLYSCRASSEKIEKTGYRFLFRTPLPALNNLFKEKI